ncbi:uncharacterized protein LOC135145231 [Zophobas morio]|uniref:uncharacterized protein LOC135145231 n=1 Tax=Zophobas morio TaxID=2755281 RepID=UPI003082F4F2
MLVGTVYGVCVWSFDSLPSGVRSASVLLALSRRVMRSSLWFAGFMGGFATLTCMVERIRNKKDALNASIAGFCMGALVAFHTRNLTAITASGSLVSLAAYNFHNSHDPFL